MRILGAVLAGGEARRFGSDKALALFNGATLIGRITATLAPQVADLILCGRAGGVADRPARIGPLGGIAAALHHASSFGYGAVVTVPCDTPMLPDDLVATLSDDGQPSFLAGLPVIGYWPAELSVHIEAYLSSAEDRSIRAWARQVNARPVSLSVDIANINTRDDLDALAQRFNR